MHGMYIQEFKINGMEASSAATIGSQVILGSVSLAKNLSAVGSISGDYSAMPCLYASVWDSDLIDSPMWITKAGPAWPS